jgi:Type II secretion system (T2SS), protein I
VGKSDGDIDYANTHWHWTQNVTDPGIAGIRRIEIAVSRVGITGGAKAEKSGKTGSSEAPALATAYGFAGLAVSAPNGTDPDWSLDAPGVGTPPPATKAAQ